MELLLKKKMKNIVSKASVKYTNVNNQNLWLAKTRIESSYYEDIQVMEMWGGSWQKPD